MVFVSLEGFLQVGGTTDIRGKPMTRLSSTSVAVPHAQQAPHAPVQVVVTPGSPAKPLVPTSSTSGQKRSRLRRATSAFSSFATITKHSSPTDVTVIPPLVFDEQFVVYVTDRDVHHKWVLAKTPTEYTTLKKNLQGMLATCTCRAFACCGPLRRIVASSQYKKPKRRWSDSRVVTQFGRCSVVQEFLNDLLLAVLRRDAECDATRYAWDAVSAFLDVQLQRSDLADKILLRTVGGGDTSGDQHLRRTVSEQLPTRRASVIVAQDAVGEGPIVGTPATTDSDSEVSDHDEDAECPICCASLAASSLFSGTETTTAQLLCGHAYHSECVRVWLRLQHTCPVCRIPIDDMA